MFFSTLQLDWNIHESQHCGWFDWTAFWVTWVLAQCLRHCRCSGHICGNNKRVDEWMSERQIFLLVTARSASSLFHSAQNMNTSLKMVLSEHTTQFRTSGIASLATADNSLFQEQDNPRRQLQGQDPGAKGHPITHSTHFHPPHQAPGQGACTCRARQSKGSPTTSFSQCSCFCC